MNKLFELNQNEITTVSGGGLLITALGFSMGIVNSYQDFDKHAIMSSLGTSCILITFTTSLGLLADIVTCKAQIWLNEKLS